MSLTTNLAQPKTSATITVRVIKSFDFRTERSLVLRDINLETTTIGVLKTTVRDGDPPPPLAPHSLTLHPNSHSDPVQMEALSLCIPWYPLRHTLSSKKEVH